MENEYKEKIDKTKNKDFSLGSYIVKKPWGNEEWLELTENYCVKIININSGFQSSLQYHEKKIETSIVISGWIYLELENQNGELETHQITKGFGWTIQPFRKHRIIAETDCKILEVQTTELDDVIRIEDKYSRENGKIESEHE